MYRMCILLALFSRVVLYKIEVKVKQGKILGTRQATLFDGRLYFAFYRIPYAQAPVQKLRFKDPKPPKKWNQTLDARTEYHGACAQAHIVHKHGIYGIENCLYLNVYTPSLPKNEDTALKPVIVWIHGYAFTSSFSHIHGPDFLIENDVLMVTLSHRIGIFGFFKPVDTDSDANMGLKDIVMALKWIRKNIKQFGGDKRNITVMSCSSAATFVSLLIMTKARKLFSKIILQSGSVYSPSIFQGDINLERRRFMDNLNEKGIKLQDATTKDIIMASLKVYTREEMQNFQKPVVPFSPIIESKSNTSLLTKGPVHFYESFSVIPLNKPILLGFNTQESISEIIPFIQNPLLLKLFSNTLKFMVPFSGGCSFNYRSSKYKIIANKIKDRYFKSGISEKSLDDFVRYTSDLIKYPIVKFIKTLLKVNGGNSTYIYKFDFKGSFNAVKATSLGEATVKLRGAANGDELCYILKCEPLWETYAKIRSHANSTDKAFMKQIANLWANFAKYGNPTPSTDSGQTTWPAMTLKEETMLFIGKSNKVIDFRAENAMFRFWNHIYEKYYAQCNSSRDEL